MSKFSAAMNAVKDRSAVFATAIEKSNETPDKTPDSTTAMPGPRSTVSAPVPRHRGRPAGKRSNESTIQVTAYIESSTHVETKIRLLQNARNQGEKQDFSGLVQQLLAEWLKSQK